MPTVTFDHATLRMIQAKHGVKHDPWLWEQQLSDIGCVVEECDSQEIEIKYSQTVQIYFHQELSWRMQQSVFLHGQGAEPELKTVDGDISMVVDQVLNTFDP